MSLFDDGAPVRTARGRLLCLADYEVAAYGSGDDFLASLNLPAAACVILDGQMPGVRGLR